MTRKKNAWYNLFLFCCIVSDPFFFKLFIVTLKMLWGCNADVVEYSFRSKIACHYVKHFFFFFLSNWQLELNIYSGALSLLYRPVVSVLDLHYSYEILDTSASLGQCLNKSRVGTSNFTFHQFYDCSPQSQTLHFR